ncbi:helix-turn-helix transcriptional regulator [Microbacterium esteraromaticum]|jgi:DNA-binding Xre family transcriptional regulator|uniref:helix-turn-helix domain-containing protein n=1 Tax=Microbacterium TaxID=33882 RepID=UPI0030A770D6
MRRTADYAWNLAELMARNGMHNSTDLAPHLNNHGLTMSSAQIWRLVTQRPERLSLPLLAALCDIFHCTPADLITVSAQDATNTKKVVNQVMDFKGPVSQARPRRARILRDESE